MTIFVGRFSPQSDGSPAAALEPLLSGLGPGSVSSIDCGGLALASYDGPGYPDPAEWSGGGLTCRVAGDPIYRGGCKARDQQLAELVPALKLDARRALADCAGSFTLVFHDQAAHRLLLATDAMGVRPLYYCQHGDAIYFASCLWLLEKLAELPKTVSAANLAEMLVLQQNLAGRTAYRDIRVLEMGEYLEYSPAGLQRAFFEQWDRLAPNEDSPETRLTRIHDLFVQAVERRTWRGQRAVSMLSGGLDSRLVLGGLLELGKQVSTINVRHAGFQSMDEIYAQLLAEAAGTPFHQLSLPETDWSFGGLMRQALESAPEAMEGISGRLICGGDGGSVGLGCVYLSDEAVAAMRAGNRAPALKEFARHARRFSPWQQPAGVTAAIERHVRAAVDEQIDRPQVEPGKRLHLYLMNNDQRCHLHNHYEDTARHQVEFLTPFFDADLLRYILACPLDPFLAHRLYHDLLPKFLPVLTQIPWQTYPGHLACPVPAPAGVANQFSAGPKKILSRTPRTLGGQALSAATGADFPARLFRRSVVLAASAGVLAGYDGYGYLCRPTVLAARKLHAAEGRMDWDL